MILKVAIFFERLVSVSPPTEHGVAHTMFPIRCYTCNACLAQHQAYHEKALHDGQKLHEVFTHLRITRMCCRRMFLGHVDLTHDQLQFGNADVVLDRNMVLKRCVHQIRMATCE